MHADNTSTPLSSRTSSPGKADSLAADCMDSLKSAVSSSAPVRTRYQTIASVFNLVADRLTRSSAINFTGLLPRVDFLLKSHSKEFSPQTCRLIHDLRYRLSIIDTIPDSSLGESFLHDVATTARWCSVLLDCEIPYSLRSCLPVTPLRISHHPTRHDCTRLIVSEIADGYLYATDADGNGEIMKVRLRSDDRDFSYLDGIAAPGSQVNIVKWRTDSNDNSILPELIIYEPDFLTDISAIAECFESYAVSELVWLIKTLQPERNSKAILLGGFASQLLDEALHRGKDVKFDYNKAIKEFFATNALRIATCEDLGPEFHTEALSQQMNIEKALRTTLPDVPGYDAELTVVEPSFFCEMLGLQGRMDMMQTDFSLLVEQKSGKGAWGSDEHGVPRHQEKHLVQLLLYQAVLHYGMGVKASSINSFLLYSKYPDPLVRPGNSPALLRKAIEVRNLTVHLQQSLASEGWLKRLQSLTPGSLNLKGISGTLWNKYIEPQLSEMLSPVRNADRLTLAYVDRLLRFISLEHLYAKTGFNAETTSSGFAGSWLTPLTDKKNAGNIYDSLTISSLHTDENGSITAVSLSIPESAASEVSNFRIGDIVVLYSYPEKSLPDIRKSVSIPATVSSLSDTSVKIDLRAPQSTKRLFEGKKLWALEHDMIDSSFRSLYRAAYSMLSIPAQRARLILDLKSDRPACDTEVRGDYGDFNTMMARSRKAGEIFAIIGPPGTGKTSFGMYNLVKEELLHPGSSVIVTAYTNRAVDEICGKLADNGIEFLRLGSHANCHKNYTGRLHSELVSNCNNVNEVRRLYTSARVVVGTTQAIAAASAVFRLRRFSLAVVDEASQILEPHMLQLLTATDSNGNVAIDRFILIGDHRQLPAVVQQPVEKSEVTEPELLEIGLTDCRNSFFERFLNRCRPEAVYEFTRQGRMHPDVASAASHFFYADRLLPVPLPHQLEEIPQCKPETVYGDKLNSSRICFIDVNPPEDSVTGNSNIAEAEVIATIVKEIAARKGSDFDPEKSVGIIVPYRNQTAAVRHALMAAGIAGYSSISVDTVERYQGSQRDYIIYGFTVARTCQLAFLTSTRFTDHGLLIDRKLNVAMTRARSHLIMVGNRNLLCRDTLFREIIQSLQL